MSANMSIMGRISKEIRLIDSTRKANTQVIFLTLATEVQNYKDKNTNEYVQKTEYYNVRLTFPKGEMNSNLNSNMFAVGHLLDIKNLAFIALAPTESNGVLYPNNTFTLLPNMKIKDNVEFISFPKAVKGNGGQQQQQAPQQQH